MDMEDGSACVVPVGATRSDDLLHNEKEGPCGACGERYSVSDRHCCCIARGGSVCVRVCPLCVQIYKQADGDIGIHTTPGGCKFCCCCLATCGLFCF